MDLVRNEEEESSKLYYIKACGSRKCQLSYIWFIVAAALNQQAYVTWPRQGAPYLDGASRRDNQRSPWDL